MDEQTVRGVIGRGRGRGRGALASSENRPGGEKKNWSCMDDMVNSVNELDLDSENMLEITEQLKESSLEDADKENIMSVLYERCQADWKLADKLVLICAKFAEDETLGPKHRTNLLKILQNDFKRKDEIRTSESSKLLGCIAMLSQSLCVLKDQRGEPFRPLYGPVFEAFELITDTSASDDELFCAVHQMNSCGRLLQLNDNSRWSRILQTLRVIVLDSRGSRDVRIQIIDVIENCASGWEKH